jgi:hypothetical protein
VGGCSGTGGKAGVFFNIELFINKVGTIKMLKKVIKNKCEKYVP